QRLGDLRLPQLRQAAGLAKNWRFPVLGTGGWEQAQVTRGGVPLKEVDGLTLESKRCPGLYLTGELLNIDGDCGGSDLHGQPRQLQHDLPSPLAPQPRFRRQSLKSGGGARGEEKSCLS